MIRDPGALPGPVQARGPVRSIAPVLIQVPALASTPRRSPRRTVRRRRLRREVRIAGSVLLMGLPSAWLALTLCGARPTRPERPGPAFAAVTEAPSPVSITISVEPATLLPPHEAQAPVALPGYILPDDGSEESAHAGT